MRQNSLIEKRFDQNSENLLLIVMYTYKFSPFLKIKLTDQKGCGFLIFCFMRTNNRANRTYKTITQLISLVQQEPLFQPFANNFKVISEVCQQMEHRSFLKAQRIYKMQDKGDYFYLLLEGTVHLTHPAENYLKQLNQPAAKEQKTQSSQSDLFNVFLGVQKSKKVVTQQQPQISQFQAAQRIIGIVEEGQSFGEMLQDNSYRLSNAYAVEACELLCLDRKSYQTLLKAQFKSENMNKYHFLEQIPSFKVVSSYNLSKISIMMKQEKLLYGQPLFHCGTSIKDIYVVKSGCFKLLRRIKRHSRMTVASKLQQFKIDSQEKKNAEYLIVNEGEVLGDSETLQMKAHYQESCICQSQQATVLAIDKKQLFKILLEDPESFEKIKQVILTKNLWKNKIVSSFVQRRTKNSLMNSYLTNPKRSLTEASKQSKECSFKQELQNETFFYNQFNKTIVSTPKKCRFSISKAKAHSDGKPPNLFAAKDKKKAGIPHGIQDIVQLVKLKTQFQKRFRRDRRQKFLFKFNQNEVPLYIKSKFDKFQ